MDNDNSRENIEMNSTPVFHYSREHRLKKASPRVRAIYEQGATARPGFMQRIFVTKRNAYFFVIIFLLCVVISLIGRMNAAAHNVKLGGNTVTADIINDGGVLILDIVKKAPKKGEYYYGAVDLAISPIVPKARNDEVREPPPVFSHRIVFTPGESDVYSISLPFEEKEFFIIIRNHEEFRTLKLRAVEAK